MKNFKPQIEKYTLHPALTGKEVQPPWIEQNAEELNMLCNFIEEQKIMTYLEIGVAYGGLMQFMEKEMKLKVNGITPEIHSTHKELKILHGKSQDKSTLHTVSLYVKDNGKFDLIFVDGNHDYEAVKADYENYKDKCRFMAFHDVKGMRDCPGVNKLWVEILSTLPPAAPFWFFEDLTHPELASGIGILKLDY
jgi:predicted O-methyltransferase YrrM